jgi:copper homeostasis protein
MTLVEVCVEDLAGAALADQAGAGRIELCAGLSTGGITPSIGTIEQVFQTVHRTAVRVLIRQRDGDFVYTRKEIDAMTADILHIKEAARDAQVETGFVLGALTPEGTIDKDTTSELLAACDGHPVTFHKAFDLTPDLARALKTLTMLGVTSVLTSGGAQTAAEGAGRLRELVQEAGARIEIVAGGGIRPVNARALLQQTGVPALHFRAAHNVPSSGHQNKLTSLYDSGLRTVTSKNQIIGMQHAVRQSGDHG